MPVVEKWLQPRGLRFISRLAEQGLSGREIAQQMGVSPYAFPSLLKKHPQIAEAIRKGEELYYERQWEKSEAEFKAIEDLRQRAFNGEEKAWQMYYKIVSPKLEAMRRGE